MVTPEGRRVGRLGSPRLATFLRSAAKPLQALPLILAGGVERYALEAADLALICASHAGTERHTRRVAALLERAGLGVEDLRCGAHEPYDAVTAAALRADGAPPVPLHNNCSGKHAGMLLACRLRGYPLQGYLHPDHPLQREILAWVSRFSGVDEKRIGLGVDGCGAPSFHLPLQAAALAWARLAEPTAGALDDEVAEAAGRLVAAMAAAPDMVAGPGRFTTRLIEVTGGRVVGKEGAEGFYGVAVRGPVALGVAVKLADGGERARDGVVLEILRQAGCLSGAELAELADFHRQPVFNHAGVEVGSLEPDLELETGDRSRS